jgi:hypothetical protein
VSTSAQIEETGPLIRLQSATFAPLAGEPALPGGLRVERYQNGVRGYYLVQFKGPIQEEWKQAMEGLGGELLDYVPDFAFIVRMDEPTRYQMQRLPFVHWVGLYHPAYKLHQDLEGLTGEMVSVTTSPEAAPSWTWP